MWASFVTESQPNRGCYELLELVPFLVYLVVGRVLGASWIFPRDVLPIIE